MCFLCLTTSSVARSLTKQIVTTLQHYYHLRLFSTCKVCGFLRIPLALALAPFFSCAWLRASRKVSSQKETPSRVIVN